MLRVVRRREDRPRHARGAPRRATARPEGSGRATLEDLYRQIQAGQTKELRVILKADVQGSLGAIRHALEQIQTDEVRINVLHEGTGDITDNDIMLASASDAIVVGFNTKLDPRRRAGRPRPRASRSASTTSSTSSPTTWRRRSRGCSSRRSGGRRGPRRGAPDLPRRHATVIAGSYVTDGRIVRGGARVYRGGKLIATDRIESLRRFRDDVREVATGYECGIGLADFNDLEEGDIIECFTQQTVSRAQSA